MDHQTTLLHVRRLKGMKRSAGEMEKSRGDKRLTHSVTELANVLDYGPGAAFLLLTS